MAVSADPASAHRHRGAAGVDDDDGEHGCHGGTALTPMMSGLARALHNAVNRHGWRWRRPSRIGTG